MIRPRLTIHRSADEIGGNCIEISYDGHRILLDAGAPLQGGPNAPLIPESLPLDASVDGLIISHPHLDHYGLLPCLPKHWPVWMGEGTEILSRMTLALSGKKIPQTIHRYRSSQAFRVGPFTITPHLIDHSACDAHMLQIEVAGRRLLYSGDFRRTGRKAKLVDRLLRVLPRPIDVLLMEGTCLGRTGLFPSEDNLVDTFAEHFDDAQGRVFISWSAQNIDRSCTIYKACRRAGRLLILDPYSLDVLERIAATGVKIPTLDYPIVQAVITKSTQRLYQNPKRLNAPKTISKYARSGYAFSASRLADLGRRGVIMLRPSLFADYLSKGLTLDADDRWLFSQWSGYRRKPEYKKVETAFLAAGAEVHSVHTSGHASTKDLVDFATSVRPKRLIPIHSDQWDKHLSRFANVLRLKDNQVFAI